MNNKDLGNIRVSLSTDAIIYLPFYLAYFGGDFEDTPYGRVNVQIVGLNDIRFKYYDEELEDRQQRDSAVKERKQQKNARLRGDAFMTLDVLYGIADIGLGDVGFVPILKDTEKSKIILAEEKDNDGQTIIEKYVDLLNYDMIKGTTDLKEIYDKKDREVDRTDLFKKKIGGDSTKLQIVGGLIRRPALKLLLQTAKATKEGSDKDLLRKKNALSGYLKTESIKKLSVFSYQKPSTAYHFIKTEIEKREEIELVDDLKNEKGELINIDFGKELTSNNITNAMGCFSCDFVALRFANKTSNDEYKDHFIAEDWTCLDANILWSGFIFDEKRYDKNKDAFKAFFYAIDKCMYKINQFLKNDDSHGLHYYIKEKLTKNINKRNDIFRVLIADEDITAKIRSNEEKKPSNIDINLDLIIRYFVKDLFYCKRANSNTSSFYYQSLNIRKQAPDSDMQIKKSHILKVVNLRKNIDEAELDKHIHYDIMEDWYGQERKINNLKTGMFKWFYSVFSKNYVRTFTLIISLVGVISLLESFFAHAKFLENYNRYQFNAVISFVAFIIILLLVYCFIKKFVVENIDILQKERFVIDSERGVKSKKKKDVE